MIPLGPASGPGNSFDPNNPGGPADHGSPGGHGAPGGPCCPEDLVCPCGDPIGYNCSIDPMALMVLETAFVALMALVALVILVGDGGQRCAWSNFSVDGSQMTAIYGQDR